MIKKIASIFLCLIMVFAMVPQAAFAVDSQNARTVINKNGARVAEIDTADQQNADPQTNDAQTPAEQPASAPADDSAAAPAETPAAADATAATDSPQQPSEAAEHLESSDSAETPAEEPTEAAEEPAAAPENAEQPIAPADNADNAQPAEASAVDPAAPAADPATKATAAEESEAPAADPVEDSAPAEEPTEPTEDPIDAPEDQPAETTQTLVNKEYTNDEQTVVVTGLLPENTIVIATELKEATKRNILKAARKTAAGPEDVEGDEILNALSADDIAAFYDIKLNDGDTEIQPTEPVTVTIKDVDVKGDKATVYHILEDVDAIAKGIEDETVKAVTAGALYERATDAAKEAATEATENTGLVYVETLEATVTDGTVEFEATSFSIYAIVDNGDEVPRATFNFKNTDDSAYQFINTAGQSVDNQILKTGDEVEDVGTPTVPDGTTFNGWYVYLNGTAVAEVTFGKTVTVNFGEEKSVVRNSDGTLTITITESDRDFDVKPFFGDVYFLTFYDDVNGRVILNMIQVPKSDDPENPTPFNFGVVGTASVTDTTTAFVGWTTVPGGTEPEYTTADVIPVTSDMTFYPVFKSGHWIYFVSAPEGSGATYIAPLFVQLDQAASSAGLPDDPFWKNHTFLYWTTQDEEGNEIGEFDWSTVISEDITLYGKWRADDIKYIISIYKQNVTDDKNATDDQKSYSFFKQYELTAPAGTLKVYTPEEYKTLSNADKANFTGFVYNSNKSEDEADLNSDGSTNIKLYYDRVTVTMNFIGYPGGTDTIYLYTALNDNDNTTSPQYGQVNGVYKELSLGTPTIRYNYNGYTGTNYNENNAPTLYGTTDGGQTYFPLTVRSTSTTEHVLSTRRTGNNWTEYTTRPVYTSNGTAVNDPVYNNTYYQNYGQTVTNWSNHAYGDLYWRDRTITTYTFTNSSTGEVYWTGIISGTNRPSLYTRTEQTIQTWLYDGEPYYGARYSRSSSSDTGLVFTGLYGQTLEQNDYSWPGTDKNGNPCYWQCDNDAGSLTGMSYLGEFVLPGGVADPNGQIINLHYNSIDNSATVEFYLMDTDGKYPSTPNDSGIVTRGGTFNFSEKYDGFNVVQYRRYYVNGSEKVYIDKDGNVKDNSDDAWATATVGGTAPLLVLVNTGDDNDIAWTYRAFGADYAHNGTRYRDGNNGDWAYAYAYLDENGYFQQRSFIRPVETTDTSDAYPQYAPRTTSSGSTVYLQLTRRVGYRSEYCNLEIRYARKQWTLSFVDSLDNSRLTDVATGQTIANQTLYYNEALGEYEPASTVVPKSNTAGYEFKGWFKDQACATPFDWSENMPNADLKVYAGWEQVWFYIKLIPDGGTLLTSQSTYFWENYGEKVVEYGNVKKNFVESSDGPYVYYFGEFDTSFGGTDPVDRDAPQATYRYSLYFTNDGTKVVIENSDGTITESENVTAYRNKKVQVVDDAGNLVWELDSEGHQILDDNNQPIPVMVNARDEEGNIIQETYLIPAADIYSYGVANHFIDTSAHYKYEKDAYALVGWYDVTDGTRRVYSFDGGVNKDTILQAYWRKVGEYRIQYSNKGVDASGAELSPAVIATSVANDANTYADNSDSAITGVAGAPDGYEFMGWYYDGEILQKGDAFTLQAKYADENKVVWIYPVFVKTENMPVHVTHILYDGNGGTTTKTSDEANNVVVNDAKTQIDYQALQINAAQTLLGDDAFTRSGYTLIGWALSANKTTPDFELGQENVAADNKTITGNTLYAVWEVKTYTVTINKIVTPDSTADATSFAFADPSFSPLISGYQGTFSLQKGGSKVYAEVPYGTTFKVTEDNYKPKYTTTLAYTVTDADDTSKNVTDVAASNGGTFTVDGNITVTVTNKLNYSTLTITKTGMKSGESAVFTVNGPGYTDLKVVVPNGGSAVIANVLITGTYNVVEDGDWTWRYTTSNDRSGSVTISADASANVINFTNTVKDQRWLTDTQTKVNVQLPEVEPTPTTSAVLPEPVTLKQDDASEQA